jgi:hypothetical protein
MAKGPGRRGGTAATTAPFAHERRPVEAREHESRLVVPMSVWVPCWADCVDGAFGPMAGETAGSVVARGGRLAAVVGMMSTQ